MHGCFTHTKEFSKVSSIVKQFHFKLSEEVVVSVNFHD